MPVPEKTNQKKIDKLIQSLGLDLGFTGKEIAEILWLALKRQELIQSKDLSDTQTKIDNENEDENSLLSVSTIEIESDGKQITSSDRTISIYADLQENKENKEQKGYGDNVLPLRVPDAPSLREPLEFARALRPLMRKINSGRNTILDEIETVEQTAKNNGICIPVLQAEPEPWLDLVLIIDQSQSMTLWEHTIQELQRLLKHYGIFREVRICGLWDEQSVINEHLSVNNDQNALSHSPLKKEDSKTRVFLRSGIGKQQHLTNPKELIDPTGRRLILIVSDCVAPFWHNGAILHLVREWVKYQPLAIVQMLPDWMWRRTGLRIGASVLFKNLVPGNSNQNLIIKELLLWKNIELEQGINIPVLTLEPQVAQAWSQMVVGKHDVVTSGFVLPLEYQSQPENLPQNRVDKLSAEKRVHRFRMNASPVARKLAGLLSAAPMISLPIVRILQASLLPQSHPVHVAEVFLGGLLKPKNDITPNINSDQVEYQFVDEKIRQLFWEDAPRSDSQRVFDAVSRYLQEHFGKSLYDFVVLLKAPETKGETTPAFAEIAFDLLKQLGGDYTAFADNLENQYLTERLIKALRERFSTLAEITSFISQILSGLSLNFNLGNLAASNINDFISNLIEWAENNGRLQQIIEAMSPVLLEPIPVMAENSIEPQNFDENEGSSTALKTCSFDITTIEILETHTFKFTVATIERETERQLFGLLPGQEKWVIKRQKHQAEGIIEVIGEGIDLELMDIPGGTFIMGTDDEEIERLVKKFDWEYFRREKPQHPVTIQPFYMGRYPITQGQWKAIAERTDLLVNIDLDPNPSNFKDDPPQPLLEKGEKAKTRWDRPVEQVNWYQAKEFCDRLSRLTKQEYRLPTEAEWEYACRAVNSERPTVAEWNEKYNQPFHFGETITGELANYNASNTYASEPKGEYRQQTTPVGYFKVANAFGLYDMHGNVYEWCEDDYHSDYEGAPTDGTAWLANDDNTTKILRGGSWIDAPDDCRCAGRDLNDPRDDDYDVDVGFRVVRSSPRT
ncbi:formylglycine-generating enzyme family protein [Crocosphaera sp. XPORK-15E]|uniref:formylglycine-generating enzyme family protein n=1 Tax=Crocosphaera sp. XPORK-15E TaxID=3110247 RepID=UPI002B21754D|nr:formylglycine-generating enzyme family protein [Crocosphaera sp. XPORK-15E]MEA5536835.1 formylglycine-generating enzyme family protein [Crocosphaera sp. XPORK-15E]